MSLFRATEWLSLACLALLGAIVVLRQSLGGTEILWENFSGGLIFYTGLICAGLVLRSLKRFPRVAAILVTVGIYPLFANLSALSTYLAFPFSRPIIDESLMRIDAIFGYNWGEAVAWLAAHPQFSQPMALVYTNAINLLVLLVLWLGVAGKLRQMGELMLTGVLCGTATVIFWSFYPSFGPSALVMIEPEIAERAGLLTRNDYGLELMRLAREGLPVIDGHFMLGTVAFPSFHIVLGLLAGWYARGTWLALPYMLAALIMVPATAIHGGHHLVDLAGGAVLFFVMARISARVGARDQVTTSGVKRPVRWPTRAKASTAAITGESAA